MSTFWERKLAQQQVQNPQPVQPATNQPWWQMGTVPTQRGGDVIPQQQELPQQHDFSKATHLKQNNRCPECDSGNYMRPSPSAAIRCFNCGYVEGRQIADMNRPLGKTSDGTIGNRARQTDSGGGTVHNYRGNISSASEAVGRVE